MTVSADPNDVAVVSARVERLVRRYPETPAAIFIVVMVIGFLLIIPIVFLAGALCVMAKVNPVLGFVGGVAIWLGVFMFLRQLLLWRRVQKVNSFVRAFEREFANGALRETAADCLLKVDGASNEVVAQVRERLGIGKRSMRHALRAGRLNAGQGLEAVADPVVDREVEALLRPLDAKWAVKSVIHWILGLGGPIFVFVMMCVFAADSGAGEVLFATAVIAVVWNLVLAFIVGMIEAPIVGSVRDEFQRRYPKGTHERDVAIAAFNRIPGLERAKQALRSDLRMEEADDGEPEDEQPRKASRHRGHQERAPAPPPSTPALEPLPSVEPETAPPMPVDHGAIPLEPVGATRVSVPVPPPPPSQAIPLQAVTQTPAASPPQAVPEPPAFCPQCGKRRQQEARFCTGCGKKLT